MGTVNFYTDRARGTYALKTVEYYDQETGEFLEDYVEGCEVVGVDYDDLQESVMNIGENGGFEKVETRPEGSAHRNFYGEIFASKTMIARGYYVYANIIMRAGYYSGAVLDWEIEFDGNTYGSAEDLADELMESVCWEKGYNAGLKKIHGDRLYQEFLKEVRDLEDQADRFCAEHCDVKYVRLGVFSNGEAIYKAIA